MQAAAQGSGDRIWEGVFTAEQAERGKVTVTRVCVYCHNFDLTGLRGPVLTGEAFMKNWGDESVYRLFSKIRDTMPPSGTVETLGDEAKVEIVAYLLHINGFPAGETPLTSEAGDLEAMFIAPKGSGGSRELPNFSLVRVLGCLTPGPDDTWLLTRSTEPVVERDAVDVSLQGDVSAGAGTFGLQSMPQFDPAGRANQRAEVTGLLYRAPGDNSLTVTAVRTVGPCQ